MRNSSKSQEIHNYKPNNSISIDYAQNKRILGETDLDSFDDYENISLEDP